MVDEESNHAQKRRHLLNDLCGLQRLNVPGTFGIEVQTDGVCAEQCCVAGVLKVGDTANLDACHNSPRSAVAGSEEVMRCSPMRNASAPTSSSRSISFLACIPLSTINNRSSGISFANRTDVLT